MLANKDNKSNFRYNVNKSLKDNKFQILIIVLICLAYISLLLYYTHGALLFGGDFAGNYSFGQALNLINPQNLLYAFSLLISLNNFYVSLYIEFFVTTFITVFGIYLLTTTLFDNIIDKNYLFYTGILAVIFYLFSVATILNTTKSILSTTSIYQGFFILFLYELAKFFKSDVKKYNTKDLLLLGIFLGLSFTPFPNYARILIVASLLFLGVLLIKIVADYKRLKSNVNIYLKIIVALIFLVFVSSLYVTYPLILNYGSVSSIAGYGSSLNTNIIFYYGSYNEILEVFRLLGSWFFPTNVVPYNLIYYTNPLIIFSTLLITILVVAVPLLTLDKESSKIIIPLEVAVLLIIFWGKGANPPLGNLYIFITQHIYFGIQLLPPNFAVNLVLPTLYAILASYSVSKIYKYLVKTFRIHRFHNGIKSKLVVFTILLLIIVLLFSAMPIFSGKAEGEYFNETTKGYFIPVNYQIVRTYLNKNSSNSVLLLPATSTYVETSWGYEGTQEIYDAYFYPIKIYTLNIFGPYAAGNQSAISNYDNITSILAAGNESNYLNISYKKIYNPYGNYSRKQGNITLYSSNKQHQIIFSFSNSLNVSNYTYLSLDFNFTGTNETLTQFENGNLSVGFDDGNLTGWYNIYKGSECQACNINISYDKNLNISLLINQEPKQYPTDSYNSSHIKAIIFKFSNDNESTFTVSAPKIYSIKNFASSVSWINSIHHYGINYILVDTSMTLGNTQSYTYVNQVTKYLTNSSKITLVYSGNYLSLYKIN